MFVFRQERFEFGRHLIWLKVSEAADRSGPAAVVQRNDQQLNPDQSPALQPVGRTDAVFSCRRMHQCFFGSLYNFHSAMLSSPLCSHRTSESHGPDGFFLACFDTRRQSLSKQNKRFLSKLELKITETDSKDLLTRS